MEYFKYLSPERIDVLESLKIRYTQAIALNDPFEIFPAIINKSKQWYMLQFNQRIKQELAQLNLRSLTKQKQYARARKKDFTEFYRMYTDQEWLIQKAFSVVLLDSNVQGYLSLSKTDKNILMWSHYASNHEGFIIGFDRKHSYFDEGTVEMLYKEQRPYLNPLQSKQDASLFYTKSLDWAYEQEVRKSMGFVEPIQLENGNTLLPYPEDLPCSNNPVYSKIRLFDLPKGTIKSITFGWKSTLQFRERIYDLLIQHQLLNVEVRIAAPHSRKYEMEIHVIKT